MPKRHAQLLYVTSASSGHDQKVVYSDCCYDKALQLPLQWKLDSVDKARLRKSTKSKNSDDGDDDSLPDRVQRQVDEAQPSALNIFISYKHTIYCAELKASDVAKKLEDGSALVELAASPVEELSGPRKDDMSGMDASGMLVNIEPTKAGATYKIRGGSRATQADQPVSSYPLKLHNRNLSGNLELEEGDAPKTVTKTLQRALRGQNGKSEAANHGGDDEQPDSEDEDTNPILNMLGITMGPNPGIKVTLDVALFPVAPRAFSDVVSWQQKRGWLPKNSFRAAWTLSDLTSARAFRNLLPALLFMLLVSLWTALYVHVPRVREFGDATVAKAYDALPPHTQDTAQKIWHFLLPDIVLRQLAPGLVGVVALLALPLAPFIYLLSSPAFSWWFRHMISPAYGQGVVYGAAVVGTEAMSKQEYNDLKAQATERPDLSGGKVGKVSDDKQERFWKDSSFDPKGAKKALEADAQWRKKFGIDNLMSSKAPHFYTMKKAFPHGMLCISKDGCAVFAMKMGVLQEHYSEIENSGMSNDDIVKHLALVYEYAFEKIDPRPLPHGRLINVMDFDGMGIMDMKGKASKLGNLCSKISKYHYPDRLHKALLINCPGMINQMWGLAKNMLDENARQRTKLYTKKDTKKGLMEVMDESDIPKEWGGSREAPFYNGEHEANLFKLVAKNNGDKLEDYKIEGLFDPSHAQSKSSGT